MRYARRRSLRNVKRRQTDWVPGTVSLFNSVNIGSTAGLNLLAASTLANYTRPTLLRIVGAMHVAMPTGATTASRAFGVWGVMKVPDVTLVTADFDPLTTYDKSWLWWQPWAMGGQTFDLNLNFPIDIGVKRKMEEGEELTMFFTNAASSTVAVEYQCSVRCLIQE